MKGVIRGIALLGLIVVLAVAYGLSNRLKPRIRCSANVQEGRVFYCSAILDYPPNVPRYQWSVKGDCSEDNSAGQTIQLAPPVRSSQHACVVSLEVYDSADDRLIGTASESVAIANSDDAAISVQTAPPGQSPVSPARPAPQVKPPLESRRAVRIDLTSWPDRTQQGLIDGAPVQGRVSEGDVTHYKVAVYTLLEGKWELQGVGTINPETRKWGVVAGFGSAYAALVVKDGFDPRVTLKALPPVGGEIIDLAVKRSN